MKIKIIACCAIVASSSVVANTNSLTIGPERQSQDVYLAGGVYADDLEDEDVTRLSLIFGARNYYQHNWFIGGEVEASYIDSDLTDEGYGFSANLPAGKRFVISDSVTMDAYGLVEYSYINFKWRDSSIAAHGLEWGLGVDFSFADYIAGVRWTRASLDGDNIVGSLNEESLGVILGYQF